MKKHADLMRENSPIIQLIIFIFAVVYFLAFQNGQTIAQTEQRIDAKITEYDNHLKETICRDLDILKMNQKRSMEAQGLTWIDNK